MPYITSRSVAVTMAGVLVLLVFYGPSAAFAKEKIPADNVKPSAEKLQPPAENPQASLENAQAAAMGQAPQDTTQDVGPSVEEKNKELQKSYDALKVDRDNLLAQSQRLLEENRKYADLKGAYDQFSDDKRLLLENKENSEKKIKSLQENLESLKLHISHLTQERNEFKKLLEEEQQNRAANIQSIREKMEVDYKGLIDKVTPLKKDNKMLTDQLSKAQEDVDALRASGAQSQQVVEVLKQQTAQIGKQNADLLADNMRLQELSRSFPAKFAEMVAQNQKLTEETAHMHYNLGVFYVNNREYIRAVEEFNKALELKPHDADTNYNLGYIYAEHLIDRPKAIEYFKKYLTYAPDAHDADWVNKYLLTWETWYGKGTLK